MYISSVYNLSSMVDFDEREHVGALTIDKVSFLETHRSKSFKKTKFHNFVTLVLSLNLVVKNSSVSIWNRPGPINCLLFIGGLSDFSFRFKSSARKF